MSETAPALLPSDPQAAGPSAARLSRLLPAGSDEERLDALAALVDRTGAVGEHYIAEGRREYGLIWLLAAGGGVVAALIAIAKTGIHHLPLPPFLLGRSSRG
jgi:hypothetical protein